MLARPYILLRESDQTTVRERLGAAVSAWSTSWFASTGDSAVESLDVLTNPDQVPGLLRETAGYWAGEAEAGNVAFAGISDIPGLTAALLGTSDRAAGTPTVLEGELLSRCTADLCHRLVDGSDPRTGSVDHSDVLTVMEDRLAPGAPGASCRAVVAGVEVALILSPTTVRSLIERDSATKGERRGGLGDRAEGVSSITDSRLRATARLGAIDLTVEELASLRVGDVIRMDALTTEPVVVDLEGLGRSLHASLGSLGGQPALQIRGRAEPHDKNLMDRESIT